MRESILLLFTLLLAYSVDGQYIYPETEVSPVHPYGQRTQSDVLKDNNDFADMIGTCYCKSLRLGGPTPQDTVDLLWKWKYILQGTSIQDEGWYIANGREQSFTSIRTFNPTSKKWIVPYFTPFMQSQPQVWEGGVESGNIVLNSETTGPNGNTIIYRLTFSNISASGFDWEGKIVSPSDGAENVFWKIWCKK